MAKEITAKFSGTCGSCGGGIRAGEVILWEKGRRSIHKACPKREEASIPAGAPTITLSFARRSRPTHDGEVGRTLRGGRQADGELVTVLSQTSRFIQEDGLSFGLDDDQGWLLTLRCREATPEETAKFEAEGKAQKDADAAERAKLEAERAAKDAEIAAQQKLYRDAVGELPSTETWTFAIIAKHEYGTPEDVVARWSTGDRSWARLLRHSAVSGETVFVLQTHDFDDDRDTLFAPKAVIEAAWAKLREERKTTVEQAKEFVEEYSRCVGADYHRWVIERDEAKAA